MKTKTSLLLFALLLFGACQTFKTSHRETQTDAFLYQKSIENAIYPEAYDWNPENKSHVGLSEFVIGANKKIVVKGIYKTEDYLRNIGIAE